MPIKVTLINANVDQHQLDFEVYDPNSSKKLHSNNDHGNNKRKFNNDRTRRYGNRSNFHQNTNHPHFSKYKH
jgi:ribonuclease R